MRNRQHTLLGDLRHQITLQSPGGAVDTVGERVTVWTNIATVKARIRQLTGAEKVLAAQRQASTSHIVVFRYSLALAALAANWRIVFRTRIFAIDKVANIDERNVEFEIECTEGLRQE